MMNFIQPATPLLVLTCAITVVLGVMIILRSYRLNVAIAAGGLVLALAVLPWAVKGGSFAGTNLFIFSAQVQGFSGLILTAALACLGLSASYFQPHAAMPREEYPLLLLLATLGAIAMVASTSFITLFLGIETLGLSMIGMIAYPRFRGGAEEAGFKYLVLAAMSSAIGLFGIGLIMLATGSLALGVPVTPVAPASHIILLTGLAFIVVAAGFKLSVVPFHIWVPDIYAGAPAPSAAYIAVVPKLAVLGVVMRIIATPGMNFTPGMFTAVAIISGLSMIIGNLLALLQENIKRLIGYSSIAHMGNVLFAVLAAGAIGKTAVMFYIIAYSIAAISAFGAIAALSCSSAARDLDMIDDLRGLFWVRPLLATIMTITILSLAGIPPAVGFIAKMYVLAAGINTGLMVLVWILVLSSILGLFYYLRVIFMMSVKPDGNVINPVLAARVSVGTQCVVALIGVLIVGFGVAPQFLITMLSRAFE